MAIIANLHIGERGAELFFMIMYSFSAVYPLKDCLLCVDDDWRPGGSESLAVRHPCRGEGRIANL
jgi:hypothetical protein